MYSIAYSHFETTHNVQGIPDTGEIRSNNTTECGEIHKEDEQHHRSDSALE